MALSMDQSKAFLKDDSIQRLPDIRMKMGFQYNANPEEEYSRTPIMYGKRRFNQGMVDYIKM